LKKIFFYLFISLVLLVACEADKQENLKVETGSTIDNFEFTGTDKQNQTFKLKAKKGGEINDTVQLLGISLYLLRDKTVIYSITSKKGSFAKSQNLIKLTDSTAESGYGILKFFSADLSFDQDKQEIRAKNVLIFNGKNRIKGTEMKMGKDFNKLKVKNVRARLFF
jgi:hypothetical protein